MSYPTVEFYTIHVPRRMVKLDGVEFPVDSIIEALETIEESDGLMTRAKIPTKIGDVLEKYNVCFRNVRGSYGRSENFEKFYEYIMYLIDQDEEER